ncbi:MAG: RNA polymerase sigma-70 factor [Bacteroidales bacterium]|jgi:RNA polymerase sigma-70 factor (ECF subfamily)|nr:RNA polymerase sigma-70 factor [Bacteroidales bacterium]
MLSDLVLVLKIREGDIKSFENLFKSYYTPLLYYSAKITGRVEVSEEIVQELFYNLWREREGLSITRSVKSYLFNSIRNRSIDYCRRRKFENSTSGELEYLRIETDDGNPLENAEAGELEKIITKSISKMPARRREIFMLHRAGEKKYEEIANLLEVSVKTVEAEMGKALKTLRKETGYTR